MMGLKKAYFLKLQILSTAFIFTSIGLFAGIVEDNYFAGPQPNQLIFRHLEGTGIGFNKGYTSVEAMLVPLTNAQLFPYANLRGHVFNNGQGAGNFGLGFRYLTDSSCQVMGANLFYDLRKTNFETFNQLGGGLEYLLPSWEFRANGYFPVGKRVSSRHGIKFDHFSGNNFIIGFKREFAFTGVDGEVAWHFNPYEDINFYLGAGPYYFKGRLEKSAWGGKVRLEAKITDYITLQGIYSYDRVFHSRGSGELALNIPFGKRKCIKRTNCCSCNSQNRLLISLYSPPFRNEIMVIDRKKETEVATDPLTGNPLFFVFVDNTSSSSGTFESPFPTLAQAQAESNPGDIIYVFPGDGTTTGMDMGITLQDSQRFLGSAVSHKFNTQLGTIQVPNLTTDYPQISGGSSVLIVTPSTFNEVSGFKLLQGIHSIFPNTVINRNIFYPTSGGPNISIISSTPGVVLIHNNDMTNMANTNINIVDNGHNLGTSIKNNNLQTDVTSILINNSSENPAAAICANSIQTTAIMNPAILNINQATFHTFTVLANSFSTAGAVGIQVQDTGSGLTTDLTIRGNAFLNSAVNYINLGHVSTINFSKNSFLNPGVFIMDLSNSSTSGVMSSNFMDTPSNVALIIAADTTVNNLMFQYNHMRNVPAEIISYTAAVASDELAIFASNRLENMTMGGDALGITFNSGSTGCVSVLDNHFINDVADFSISTESATMCFRMRGNNAPTTGYQITNNGGGDFFIDPFFTDNIGTINLQGTFTLEDQNQCCFSH
jgi:hypothetical protein